MICGKIPAEIGRITTLLNLTAGVMVNSRLCSSVKSGTTVYIHRNAVVYGSILGVNVKNIKILGEGVLDGSFYERKTDDFLLGYDYSRVPEASWEKQQMKNIGRKRALCAIPPRKTEIKSTSKMQPITAASLCDAIIR